MTRMFGIAASAAGAPDKMSDDWTQNAGIERASDECRCESSGKVTPLEELMCVYGIPRSLNCISTFI